MANVKLVFYGSDEGQLTHHELTVFANTKNELFIEISDGYTMMFTALDKETAIKLSKEIRKQISYLEESL